MMEDRPWLFPPIPGGLTTSTIICTPRRSSLDDPQEYRFTIEELAAFLIIAFNFSLNNDIEISISESGNALFSADQLLEVIVIKSAVTQTIKIGTTAGGSEVFEDEVQAGVPLTLRLDLYLNINTYIYFTGTFDAKIYRR